MTDRELNREQEVPFESKHRIDLACDRFEHAWKLGPRPRIGDFLLEFSQEDRPSALRELIMADIELRILAGENPQPKDYLAEFPDDQETVDQAFLAIEELIVTHGARPQISVFGSSMLDTKSHTGDHVDDQQPAAGSTAREHRENASDKRYQIIREHARGGLGRVSTARDLELYREVAVKELLDQHADDTECQSRFLREAEITSRLEHPGVVPVHGLGRHANGRPYYAMRFIRGDSLKDVIDAFHADGTKHVEEGARNARFRELLGRFVDVCNTTAYAHSRGILHRDLKPANIMAGSYGETLLVDWGLARVLGKAERVLPADETMLSLAGGSGNTPTLAGSVIGTPAFMSPEQALGRNEQLTTASDIYSLGATLYYLLTGQPAVQAGPTGNVLQRIIRGEITRPRLIAKAVPKPLESICLKAMALEPTARYESAIDLAKDIDLWLAGEPVSAYRERAIERFRRWTRRHRTLVTSSFLVLTTAVIALAVGLVAVQREHRKTELAQLTARDAVRLEHTARRRANQAHESAAQAERNEAAAVAHLGETQKAEAISRRQAAEARQAEAEAQQRIAVADRVLYARQIATARLQWESGAAATALDSLNATRVDFRGWEFRFLKSLFGRNQLVLRRHTSGVTCLAFSPDGSRLASGGGRRDGSLVIWDTASGDEEIILLGHTDGVHGVAYMPDGQRILSGGADGTIRIWNSTTGKQQLLWESPNKVAVRVMSLSSDGTRLAVGLGDRSLSILEPSSLRELARAEDALGESNHLRGIAFSPDAATVAVGGANGAIRLFDGKTAQSIEYTTESRHTDVIRALAFMPDGQSIVSGSRDGTLQVRNASSGTLLWSADPQIGDVTSMAVSPDGTQVFSGMIDGSISVWDAVSGKRLRHLKGHNLQVWAIAVSPADGRVASGSLDSTVILSDNVPSRLDVLDADIPIIQSVAISPDGMQVAAGGTAGAIRMWDVATAERSVQPDGRQQRVTCVAFSPDGLQLVSCSVDGTVKLWNTRTGVLIHTFQGHTKAVQSAAFSPDGTRVVSGSVNGQVVTWDADSGEELISITATAKGIRNICDVAFSPDGARIAAAARGGGVVVWDSTTGEQLAKLQSDSIGCIAFSPDWQHVAIGGLDGKVQIRDVATGQSVNVLSGHTGRIRSLAWSPDATRIFSASEDRTIKVWDPVSGLETLTLRGHWNWVMSLKCDGNGTRIVSGGMDRTVRIWDAAEQ